MAQTTTLESSSEFSKFTENAKKAILLAFESARTHNSSFVTPRHLFIGLLRLRKGIANKLLEKLGLDINATLSSLENFEQKISDVSNEHGIKSIRLDDMTKDILAEAVLIASSLTHVYVGTEHLLLAILKVDKLDFVSDLGRAGLDYEAIINNLQNYATYHPGIFRRAESEGLIESDEEESQGIKTYASDMNKLAQEDQYLPIYGRNDEIERMIHILARKTKSNPILVGEAGVGKTAIVEGLVQRIVQKKVPRGFENKIIYNIDLASILAGSKIRGDVEERIIGILNEAKENNNIILFIDEVHMIVGAGSAGQGTMDVANILKPHLTSGNISIIGATTYAEYQKYFETDSALTRRFQPIFVDEIKPEEAIRVMANIRPKLEKFHGVQITDKAIEAAVNLSHRYISERFLPDKAIDLLDEAAAGQKIKSGKATDNRIGNIDDELSGVAEEKEKAFLKGDLKLAGELRKKEVKLRTTMNSVVNKTAKPKRVILVDAIDVQKIVSKQTKVPVEKIDNNAMRDLLHIEQTLGKYLIGQPDAVRKVATAMKRARVGISDASRPMASFIFLGPTGVGKTEMARVLASEVLGDVESLIQVDMSEYMEQHSVSKLIGSPPGYVGFQEGGQLTERVRRKPYSVVLFDEVEKAHPDVLNILLQILDEGHLQDSKGRQVNFKNTIVILTSNIGADEVGKDKLLGFSLDDDISDDKGKKLQEKDFDEMRTNLLDELKNELRPELLNRIDEIIVFRGLDDEDIFKIAKLEIEKLNARLKANHILLVASNRTIKYIAQKGASKEYGARNIKRKVRELVEDPLAELILEKRLDTSDRLKIVNVNKVGDSILLVLKK